MLRVKGVASLTETITLVEGLPARVLAVDRRRAPADRPAPRRPAPARRGDDRAARHHRADRLAAPADRRRRRGHERRGAQPPPGVRRRGGAGAHHPPQQGPRVPDRLLPVPVGAGLDPQRARSRSSSTTPTRNDERASTSGWTAPTSRGHRRQHEAEQRGEDLRLAYVALTRAQHQAVVWWAGSWDSRNSPLGRLLFARDADGNVAAGGRRDPEATPPRSPASRRSRSTRSGCISVERSHARPADRMGGPADDAGASCRAARFDRDLDWRWRRTSYSDITAGSYEARVASEPEESVVDDEEPRDGPAAPVPDDAAAVAAARRPVAAGRHAGRRARRHVRAPRLRGDRLRRPRPRRRARRARRRRLRRAGASTSATRRRWSPACAPRSRRRSARCSAASALRDIARADRLDELIFELPLVGGDAPTGRLPLAAIAAVLREHLPPTTRSPATPTASTTRSCARACAAT